LAKIWTKVCGLVFLAHPVDR